MSTVQNAGWYPLNRWTFSNRTWYCDASSWTAVTQCLILKMNGLLCSRSQWRFKLLVTLCPDPIFWTIWPQPVRRTIDSRDVPLSAKLTRSLLVPILTTKPTSSDPCPHPDNKAHFVRSLSLPPLIQQTPVDKTIVAGGGFSDATQTESPNPDKDVSFVASYEEADTKTFLSLICF